MSVYYPYALVIGTVCSCMALAGFSLRRPAWVLTAMVISAVTASPIVSFTRGAAGAIFASDIVALTVLIVLVLHIRRNMFRKDT